MLGLCCGKQAFSCGEWGLLSVEVFGLLTGVASLTVEWALGGMGFSSCNARALEHRVSNCGAWA